MRGNRAVSFLAVLIGLAACSTLHAAVIWEEKFEIREKVFTEWKQTYCAGMTLVETPVQGLLHLDPKLKRSGQYSARLTPMLHKQITVGTNITHDLPPNKGGVLTVWMYDSGHRGSQHVQVIFDGHAVSLGIHIGNRQYYYVKGRGTPVGPVMPRSSGWHRVQFVLDETRTKGHVHGYIDGIPVVETDRTFSSFKKIRLGTLLAANAYSLHFDDASLDDDPASIEKDLFRGIKMHLKSDRVGNLFFDDDEKVPLVVRLKNYAPKPQKVRLSGKVLDREDNVLYAIPTRECELAGGEEKEETLAFDRPAKKGLFYARISARNGGKALGEQELGFGVTFNPREAKKHRDSLFGLHGGRHWLPVNTLPPVGFKWKRLYVREAKWANIEPVKGKFHWKDIDALVKDIRAHDEEILFMVGYCPQWASSASESLRRGRAAREQIAASRHPPRDMAEYTDYLEKVVTRFKGDVKYWEIWNEVNAGYFLGDARQYFEVLKASCNTIKKIDPEAKIIALTGTANCADFMDEVMKLGGLKYMDILAYHFYPHRPPEEYGMKAKIESFKALMARHGKVLPIWDTETGYNCVGLDPATGRPMTPEETGRGKAKGEVEMRYYADDTCADWLVRQYVIQYANGVEKLFWHGGRHMIHTNGVVTLFGLAHAAMAHEVAGASFIRRLDLGSENLRGYLFKKGPAHIAILWAVQGEATVDLALPGKKYSIMDIWGNETPVQSPCASVRLPLRERPVYLKNISAAIRPARKALSLQAPALVETASFEMRLTLANDGRRGLKGVARLKLPEGWRSAPQRIDVRVKSRSETEAAFKVTVPYGMRKGTYTVGAEFADNRGSVVLSDVAEIAVRTPALCGRLKHAITIDGDLADWTGVEHELTICEAEQVQKGRSPHTDLVNIRAALKAGERFWEGREDLSASVRTAWDEKYLYLGITVVDDAIINEYQKRAYLGDCVELYWDGRTKDEGQGSAVYTDGVFHLMAVPPLGGRPARMFCSYDGLLDIKGDDVNYKGQALPEVIKKVESASKTFEKRYTLEVRIPFAAFHGTMPHPGAVFGFDVMVNDQDRKQEPRKSVVIWAGKMDNHKNPSSFGRLMLSIK